ncbi:hypothetical protein Micbo1qcDRAFT_166877 [Microdochium bolleyi]|uniref:Extracellular membrane protein CFEM domain-containing protein n=1 Tax=Microdochium bolleyi TaxID=196109 RepID=A0A136ITM0_9PEZI|nr:hypothetical protein Micbo1qcDRAFT_166877 [Microdochium bolleyi]
MRFTSFLIAGAVAAVAHAQSTSGTVQQTATSTGSSAPAQSSVVSLITQCLDKCDPADTKCRANCVAVPSPNDDSANATTQCAAKCNQGNGSAEQNVAWGECVAECIKNHYYASTGTPNATGAAGNGSGSGSGSASATVQPVTSTIVSNGSTMVSVSTPTPTKPGQSGSSSSPTAPANAAGMVTVGTGAGVFGLVAALFAL